MNPITYCTLVSCSDQDWEMFGIISLITIVLIVVINGILWLIEKLWKG